MSGRRKVAVGIGAAIAVGIAVSAVLLILRDRQGGKTGGHSDFPELEPNPPPTETPGSIVGEVQTKEGAPVQGAVVTPFTFVSGSRRGESVETDAAGEFRLDGLRPGSYIVRAEKAGIGAAVRERVVVDPHGTHRMQDPMFLRSGASLVARCQVKKGDPVAGVTAVLFKEVPHEGGVEYPVALERGLSGSEGELKFEGLGDGNYYLKCSKKGYAIRNERFRIAGGKAPDVRIMMTAVQK